MVEQKLPKLTTRVRFPSPAPVTSAQADRSAIHPWLPNLKILIVLGFVVVALTLVIGAFRSRGAASKEADDSYVLLAKTARYFLYAMIAMLFVFALANLLQD